MVQIVPSIFNPYAAFGEPALVPTGEWILNALLYGAKGDGVTDDTAAIQRMIDASIVGTTLWFPSTGSKYIVSQTVLLDPQRRYMGDFYLGGTTFKMKDGVNQNTPVMAMRNWYNNIGSSNGVELLNFAIEGNKTATSGTIDGIILCTWQSVVRNLHITDTSGNGITFSDNTRNGTVIAGTVVENRIENCRIQAPEGHGIFIQDTSGKVTDGFCINNIINSAMKSGIWLDRSAGWLIQGNHSYSSANRGEYGIRADNGFDTRIIGNYIDNYGQSNIGGSQFWSAIRLDCSSGGGSIPVGSAVLGNTIRTTADNVGGSITYRHLHVVSKSTLTTSAAITGNVINGGNTANEVGLRVECLSTSTFDIACTGNQVSFVPTAGNRFQFVKTGTAISGQIDCYGVGTPEGVITAPIGSIYRRSDGGALTTLFVKETTTGNTGWVGK